MIIPRRLWTTIRIATAANQVDIPIAVIGIPSREIRIGAATLTAQTAALPVIRTSILRIALPALRIAATAVLIVTVTGIHPIAARTTAIVRTTVVIVSRIVTTTAIVSQITPAQIAIRIRAIGIVILAMIGTIRTIVRVVTTGIATTTRTMTPAIRISGTARIIIVAMMTR